MPKSIAQNISEAFGLLFVKYQWCVGLENNTFSTLTFAKYSSTKNYLTKTICTRA